MLISFNWLGRHIDLGGVSPAQVADDLTLSTAEVEGVEEFLPHARAIVVGRVVARAPHPKADRLSLCRVDVGDPEAIPIVCGASNVAEGQTVAVALPGTTLPGIGQGSDTTFGQLVADALGIGADDVTVARPDTAVRGLHGTGTFASRRSYPQILLGPGGKNHGEAHATSRLHAR